MRSVQKLRHEKGDPQGDHKSDYVSGRILMLPSLGHVCARAARDFFRDFDILGPELPKFAGPQGRAAQS